MKVCNIGLACVDVSTGSVEVGEFSNHDPNIISDEVYQYFATTRPAEILVFKTSNNVDLTCIDKLHNKVPTSCLKDFTVHGVDDTIGKLAYQSFIFEKAFNNSIVCNMLNIHEALNLEKHVFASTALTALLRYILDHDSCLVRKLSPPSFVNNNHQVMDLYYNCVEQLDLHHLVPHINKCITPVGKRYFKHRLFHPFVKHDDIIKALDHTEFFLDKYDVVRKILVNISDIERLLRKISIGKCNPYELVNLVSSLDHLQSLAQILGNHSHLEHVAKTISKHIKDVLDLDKCEQVGSDGINASCFVVGNDQDFDKLVAEKNNAVAKYENVVKLWSSYLDIPCAFKLERNERDGMFIVATSKRYECLKNKKIACKVFDSLDIHSTTNTHMKLQNKDMRTIDASLCQLDDELITKSRKKYFDFLVNIDELFGDEFKAIVDFIAYCDFYSCTAILAKEQRYVRPSLLKSDCAGIRASQMRHPLVEIINNKYAYVPNDIDLISKKSWLLYGLNAAGKSTLMKMVALNCIMAQAGLYVPCDSMEIAPYSSIFTRITKGDDIIDSKSTFVVEISELRNILLRADHNSLVIGDEICCSSEILSAISIVHTSLTDLLRKNVSFIFATHLHELVDHFHNDNRIRICHVHVEFDGNTLKYDRLLQDGEGPKTYGIEVCRFLNMPGDFVSRALQMRQTLEYGKLESTGNTSRYNSKMIFDRKCMVCKQATKDVEVHHIQMQSSFDKQNESQKMNSTRNLLVLCSKCHDQLHQGIFSISGKILTSNGVVAIVKNNNDNTPTETLITDNDLQQFVLQLYTQGLTMKLIIDKVYRDKGISLSLYKLRKLLGKNQSTQ